MVSHKVSVEDTSLVLASNPMPWQWQPDVSSEKWILRLTNHFQVELLEPQSCSPGVLKPFVLLFSGNALELGSHPPLLLSPKRQDLILKVFQTHPV